MSRKGHCYDNAVAESFFSTLKNELVHHQTYHTRDEASRAIFAFIEGFYNRQRLHQSLGYLSPLEFERRITLNLVSTKPGPAQESFIIRPELIIKKQRRSVNSNHGILHL